MYILDHFRPAPSLTYKEQLKQMLVKFLSVEDYKEFTEGLTDFDLYETMDEDLKVFVQAYYNEDVPLHLLVKSPASMVCES
jgi:hypothetical protein